MSEFKIDVGNLIWGEQEVINQKIGLFFGTFNPIHVGHLMIANYVVESTDLDEVWFVVTPHNPHKVKANLLADHHRLAMVREAIDDNIKLKASDIEFSLPQPNYTVDTLVHLKEKYPKRNFALIMGEDNLRTFHKWKNSDEILKNHPIFVYPRTHTQTESEQSKTIQKFDTHPRIIKCNAPILNLSATFIRNAIKDKRDIRYMVTEPVYKYIDEMNFYK